jgi:non-ribosomal peptide synthetase component F
MGLGELEKEIVGALEYDEDIFPATTTARMLEDYLRLLELMVADPDKDLSTISLTSRDEIEQLSSPFVANLEV